MESVTRNKSVSTAALLGLALLTAGCIAYVVPVDSWESDSLEDHDFEEYVGSAKDEIIADVGQPTYILTSRELKETYYLYERDRFVETEWGHAGVTGVGFWGVSGDRGRMTTKDGKSCYLLVFDTDDRLVRHETDRIRYIPGSAAEDRGSTVQTDTPGNALQTNPDLDCRKFYWNPEELSAITKVANLEATESNQPPEKKLRVFTEIFAKIRADYVTEVSQETLFDNAIRGLWNAVGVEGKIPQPPAKMTSSTSSDYSDPTDLNLAAAREFTEAFVEARNHYKTKDDEMLMEAAIKEMVAGLDPYSAYFIPEEYKELQAGTSGRFGGVGVIVQLDDDALRINHAFEDMPAHRAGVEAGDLVVRIDDTPIERMTLSEAVKTLNGKPGTDVVLTVIRENENEPLKITITREIVHVANIRSLMLEPGYAYIRILNLKSRTKENLIEAIAKLEDEADGSLKGLVLDLRNNTGGILSAAIGVSDVFLKSGTIVYTEGRTEDAKLKFTARPDDALDGRPIAVLVSGGTAAGAEIVSAALQDHDRAIIVGSGTLGQGSIQTIFPMDDGGALKLTTAYFYSPSGLRIENRGVIPHLCVQGDQIETIRKNARRNERDNSSICPKQTAGYRDPKQDEVLGTALQVLKDQRRYTSTLSQ